MLELHGRRARRGRGGDGAAAASRRWPRSIATTRATPSTRSTSSARRSSRDSPSALAREHSFVLVAEGLPGGRRCYPAGGDEASADWWIIVDPIDGTRGLMYQKRSAWILTGVAPNRGPGTSLRDIVARGADRDPARQAAPVRPVVGGAGRGRAGAALQPADRRVRCPIRLRPSTATTHRARVRDDRPLLSRRARRARRDRRGDRARGAWARHAPGKAHCFEDQYASTGGQLYELMAGHDRFIADLRPLLRPLLAGRGAAAGAHVSSLRHLHRAHRGGERRDRDRSRTAGRSTCR